MALPDAPRPPSPARSAWSTCRPCRALRARPGRSRWRQRAVSDAEAYAEAGFDGVLVENFGDAPFFAGRVPPETSASLAMAARAVRDALPPAVTVGVNVLRNDGRAAIADRGGSGPRLRPRQRPGRRRRDRPGHRRGRGGRAPARPRPARPGRADPRRRAREARRAARAASARGGGPRPPRARRAPTR